LLYYYLSLKIYIANDGTNILFFIISEIDLKSKIRREKQTFDGASRRTQSSFDSLCRENDLCGIGIGRFFAKETNDIQQHGLLLKRSAQAYPKCSDAHTISHFIWRIASSKWFILQQP